MYLVMLLLLVSLCAPQLARANVRYQIAANHAASFGGDCVNVLSVSLRLSEVRPDVFVFEANIRNESESSVLVMRSPVAANGSVGPYVSIDPDDESVLLISSRLYPVPSDSFMDIYGAGVTLAELGPGASIVETLEVRRPLRRTMPPLADLSRTGGFDVRRINGIRCEVGYLPDDEGIRDIVTSKAAGPFVTGIEPILRGRSNGQSVYQCQSTAKSAVLAWNPN